MQVFRLQTPILNKIKSVVEQAVTDGNIPANQEIDYLDYQPDEGFLQADIFDGAVAVYASGIAFPESAGTKTEEQDNDSMITIDCYGFGDPVKEGDDIDVYKPTAREAQIRAEQLLTIAYQAVMDRRELKGAPAIDGDPAIPIMFDSGVDVGVDKYPVSVQKFDTIGTTQSKRGVSIYRLIIKFGLQEKTREETLGEIYAGSDNITSDTFYPPTGEV